MMITPSAVMRRSLRAQRRALIGSGSDEARTSKRRCTALETLFTFCPPAPCARTAVHSISEGSIGVTGGPRLATRRERPRRSYWHLSAGPAQARGNDPSFADAKSAFDEQRQRRCGNCAREQQRVVVERQPGDDAFTVATCADERGNRRGT